MLAECEHDRLKADGYHDCGKCGEVFGLPIAERHPFRTGRRVKVLRVPATMLLNCLTSPLLRRGKFIEAITIESLLPQDSGLTVQCVQYDALRGEIGFIVHHQNFPEITDGITIPELTITVRSSQIRLTESQVAQLVMDKMVAQ